MMNVPLAIASDEADAAAASAVEQHHAEMSGALHVKVQSVLSAAAGDVDGEVASAAGRLAAWCSEVLVPHAGAEEATLYAAAKQRPEGRLLVEGMIREHAVILDLVREIGRSTAPVEVGAAARALQVMFDNHLEKENTLVLPLLVGAPDVSLAELLDGLHQLVGGSSTDHAEPAAHDGQACGCGEVDGTDHPVLDARTVPHAIRHATVLGALESIRPGAGMILLAPHDPKPLLAQVERRHPGLFRVEYLERGPQDWRLAFVRLHV